MKFNFSNIQTVSIEGIAGTGKNIALNYFLRVLMNEYIEENVVIFSNKFQDFEYFKGYSTFLKYGEVDIEDEVTALMSNTEESKIIIFNELDEKQSGRINQLIQDNKVHIIFIVGQSLSNMIKVDLELIGRSTPAKESFKGVNLTDLNMGQFWANRIMLLNFPYTDYNLKESYGRGF